MPEDCRQATFALITGGSSGMGLEYARQLAARGYGIVLVSNDGENLRKAGEEIEDRFGVRVETFFADLGEKDSADRLYDAVRSLGLDVEILVNNAGMFMFGELSAGDGDGIEKMMYLHMFTTTRLCLLFGEEMKRKRRGHILNMSSAGAELPWPGLCMYSSTKSYIKSFGKSLHYEMKPYGVGVSTSCPGAVATPLYNLKDSLMRLGVRLGVIKKPEMIVRRTLKAMFRNRRVINPSMMSLYLPVLVAMVPKGLVRKVWERTMSKA